MSTKGLTQIISAILMISITIAAISFTYVYLTRTASDIATDGTNKTQQTFDLMGVKLKIDSVSINTVYVRNSGTVDLPNSTIALYINGSSAIFNLTGPIKKGEIGMLKIIPLASGHNYTVRVTAGKYSDSVYAKIP